MPCRLLRFLSALLIVAPTAACGAGDRELSDDGIAQDNTSAPTTISASAHEGDLLAYQAPQGDCCSTFVISARFGDPAAASADEPSRLSDACELRVVAPGAVGPAPSGTPARLPQAGTMTVSSGDRSETVTASPDGAYAKSGLSRSPAALWRAGDTLTVSAEGGEIPAFGLTAQPPPPLRLSLRSGDQPEASRRLDRTSATSFSWEPLDGGVVHVQLTVGELVAPGRDPRPVRVLECTWPASDGYGEVPAHALQAQPAGEATLRAYVQTSSHAAAGDYAVTLTMIQEATVAGLDADEPLIALR